MIHDFDRYHLRKWLESGHSPILPDETEEALEKIESYLNSLEENEREFAIDKGWYFVWNQVEKL